MDWLPGYGTFGSHTPVLWFGTLLGAALGFVAARVRARGTVFEGKRWILGLGVVAGIVAGSTVTLFWGLLLLLFRLPRGTGGTGQLLGVSVLSQLALFAVVVLRGRSE